MHVNHYSEKYNENEVKNIVMMNKKAIATEIYRQMMNHFVRDEGIISESVYSDKPINLTPDKPTSTEPRN